MFEMEVYTPLGSGTEAWGPVAIPLHPRSMEKIAGTSFTPQKLIDFMDRIRPRDDGRYVLLNAIGAYEYWSSNANADAFSEWSLKGEPPPPMVKEFIRAKGLPMPTEYGCDTFERYAYTYRYHQNQDPTLTIGERVCCAAYNDKMHRVELIVFVSNEKAPDLVQRIDAGEPIPWSMGAKLPYDICAVCMNVATRREDYCEHLKNMKNHVLPDGQKVFSWNWFPRFFDISAVIVPADRSAYSLKKIASVGGPFVEIVESPVLAPPMAGIEKFAGILDFLSAGGTKKADIEKEVPVEEPQKNLGPSPIDPDVWKILFNRVAKDQATSETLPKEMMDLKGFSPQTILSALTSLGVILKPEEAGYLLGDQKVPADLDLKQPDPTLLGRSKGLIEKRSMFDPFFSMRTPREASIWRPTVLVKRANSYDSYKAWLSHVDLEQLKAVTSHPSVQMLLNPSLVEEKILGLEKSAGVPSFLRMVTPFVAGAGAD